MVLKDASGIVKMYSMVNVRNYNIVVTSDTQDDVFRKYKTALSQSTGSALSDDLLTQETVVVEEILYITQSGETVVYVKSYGKVFRLAFNEDILFVNAGDSITVWYAAEGDGVIPVVKFER